MKAVLIGMVLLFALSEGSIAEESRSTSKSSSASKSSSTPAASATTSSPAPTATPAATPAPTSSPTSASSSDLSKVYPMKLGNLVALSLQQATEVYMKPARFHEPIIVAFDSKDSMLGIKILDNGRSTIDSAKKSIDEFKTDVLTPALAHTNEALGTAVTEDQIRITYLIGDAFTPLITFENGTFVIN